MSAALTAPRAAPTTPSTPASRSRLSSVRVQILLFVLLGVLTLIVVTTILQLTSIQQQAEAQVAATLNDDFDSYLHDVIMEGNTASAAAAAIAARADVRALLAAGDRDGLISLMTPLFATLRDEYQIKHLYFHDPFGTVIARLHNPAQFGDSVVLSRQSAADAITTMSHTEGIELGSNFLGIRSVVPVIVDGALIGLVETGFDIDPQFVSRLAAEFGADYTLWLLDEVAATSNFNTADRARPAGVDGLFFYSSSHPDLLGIDAAAYQRVLADGTPQTVNVESVDGIHAVLLQPLTGYDGRLMGIIEIALNVQPQLEQLGQDQVRILAVSALIIAISLPAFWWVFNRLILKPLATIERTMQQRQAGDAAALVPDLGQGEFGSLGTTYNQLVTNLDKLLADEKATVVEKEKLVRQIKETSRFKDEFLAVMSHELRTPLNAIIGLLGIVNMSGKVDEQNRMMIQRARANSERLLGLINNILDISRMEAGRLQIVPSDLSLRRLLNTIETDMGVLAQQKQLAFAIDVADNVPDNLFMDEDALTKIVVNLISNAFKFTTEGSITVDVTRHDRDMVIAVADTGQGIPQHMQDVIFESFRQVDSSSTRRHGGTGLGLAIVRNLCNAMNGTIRVDSTPGKGSTFTVVLPLTQSVTSTAASTQELRYELQHN